MTVAHYIVEKLKENGVTDVFGVPGGVVLDFLYTVDGTENISAHLSYHEQASAFEAIGYAQVNHTLGVAYATRGPGFTNLITGIADAYADSLPVLFITGHSGSTVGNRQRFEKDQEMDTVSMVKSITKYAAVIDEIDGAAKKINTAIYCALNERKGPVLLDISANLWNKDIDKQQSRFEAEKDALVNLEFLDKYLKDAKRPIFLLGDGVRQGNVINAVTEMMNRCSVPVLTSRCSQDVGVLCKNYYGYIGSHGIRYCNFIFAKADLVISIGNRLAFPLQSESFSKSMENKRLIRIDVDKNELERNIPNTFNFVADLQKVNFEDFSIEYNFDKWLEVCGSIKELLLYEDIDPISKSIGEMLNKTSDDNVVVADVGNNEFCLSRAYEIAGVSNRLLYSKSFGVLGCAIGKAIGAYYKTGKPTLCVVGDQGFQFNIQELQLISKEQLPIIILVINNKTSGMIRDREAQKYNSHYVHTTLSSGYGCPNIENIAKGYDIEYKAFEKIKEIDFDTIEIKKPLIIEAVFDENINLTPNLPKGNAMQDMFPAIDKKRYELIDRM